MEISFPDSFLISSVKILIGCQSTDKKNAANHSLIKWNMLGYIKLLFEISGSQHIKQRKVSRLFLFFIIYWSIWFFSDYLYTLELGSKGILFSRVEHCFFFYMYLFLIIGGSSSKHNLSLSCCFLILWWFECPFLISFILSIKRFQSC